MSRRDRLKHIFDGVGEELAAANSSRDAEGREPAGPIRTMALTLGKMEDEARAVRDGEYVVSLDPALIDISFVRDRLTDDIASDDDLVNSIRENGQEVPILVRQHPERQGRYQVAYGHRRLQAVRLLGRPVRAVIRPLEDTDVVIAQGIENSARQNLSYIERALFAHTLEGRGFDRQTIMQALSTDKTELSKLISVARAVPGDVIRAIGSAPSIGRRRWIALADDMDVDKIQRIRRIVEQSGFRSATSDDRFELVANALEGGVSDKMEIESWQPEMSGRVAAVWKIGKRSFTLSLKAEEAAGFGAFIGQKLDMLYDEFKQTKSGD